MRSWLGLAVLSFATIFVHPTVSVSQDTSAGANRARPMRIRVSASAAAASLATRVEPKYPENAKRRQIEGQVVLHVIIGTDGATKELNVISGPQELTQSAVDAVKEWRYKPFFLNAQPLEVDTTVTVDFALGASLSGTSSSSGNPSPSAVPRNSVGQGGSQSNRSVPCTEKSPSYSEVRCLEDLGAVYEGQKKYAEAEEVLKRALDVREESLGPDNPDVAWSAQRLGYSLIEAGKYAEAESYLKRAVSIRERALGPESREVSESLQLLGRAYSAHSRYSDAEQIDARALAIRKKAYPPDDAGYANVAESMDDLGMVYLAEGKASEAQPLFEQALQIRENALQPDHPLLSFSLDHLARAYTRQGKYEEAESSLKRALGIASVHGDSILTVFVMLDYAELMRVTKRTAEAEDMKARAAAIRDKLEKP